MAVILELVYYIVVGTVISNNNNKGIDFSTCPLRSSRHSKKGNPKSQLCRQHVLLEALYFGVWWIASASKSKCCRLS